MKISRFFPILIPIIAVLLGLIVGALLMLGFGYSPIEGYASLWDGVFGDWYVVGETIRQVTPLILTGLAVAFAFRAGLFRSDEHTSELQSRFDLVCRLLLDK